MSASSTSPPAAPSYTAAGSSKLPSTRDNLDITPASFYLAGCRAHDVGDLSAAAILYTTSIDLDPNSNAVIKPLVGRGVIQKEQGAYEEAIKDYTRALQLSSSPATTLLILSNRANCLTSAGSFAAALNDHNSALALNKDDAVLWTNRGSTLMKLGRLEESLFDFQRALEVDPVYAPAWYNIGLVHGRQGRISHSMSAFDRARSIFLQTPLNGAHASDCDRQMEYFGGSTCGAGPSSPKNSNGISSPFTSPARRPTPHIDISPLSPVHQRGISRSSYPGPSASKVTLFPIGHHHTQQQHANSPPAKGFFPGSVPSSTSSSTPSPTSKAPSYDATIGHRGEYVSSPPHHQLHYQQPPALRKALTLELTPSTVSSSSSLLPLTGGGVHVSSSTPNSVSSSMPHHHHPHRPPSLILSPACLTLPPSRPSSSSPSSSPSNAVTPATSATGSTPLSAQPLLTPTTRKQPLATIKPNNNSSQAQGSNANTHNH